MTLDILQRLSIVRQNRQKCPKGRKANFIIVYLLYAKRRAKNILDKNKIFIRVEKWPIFGIFHRLQFYQFFRTLTTLCFLLFVVSSIISQFRRLHQADHITEGKARPQHQELHALPFANSVWPIFKGEVKRLLRLGHQQNSYRGVIAIYGLCNYLRLALRKNELKKDPILWKNKILTRVERWRIWARVIVR